MMPQTGFLLHGRYQIVQELGSGGFATVYLAQDGRLNGRYVAVKEFNVAKLAPADRGWARQSFQHEASVLSGLNHESIAAISDFFSMGGLDYLVMEYVPGETLTQAWQRAGKRIHPDRMLIWAWELCRVLDYLHRQNPPIIFRDLKPDNIMVMPDGRLKIIDFGIARHFKPGQTRDTHALGTPGYASPEQYRPVQTDARSDVYSLAVVLHQLLTGYDPSLQPFAPLPDVLALSPHVPAHIARAIHQALNADPARRFPLVRDFAAALGSSVAPPVGGALPTRNATRSWIWIMGSVVVLGLFGFFAGLGALFLRQTPATATPTAVVSTEVVTVMVTAVATSDPPMPTATLAVHAGEAVTVTPILAPTVTPLPYFHITGYRRNADCFPYRRASRPSRQRPVLLCLIPRKMWIMPKSIS
ncbi:MAG: serine/threonine protein kinase [Chloroflexi bacterium]|nr:serine/threonine protein kinase [Chloroflexota bacterium]